MEQKKAHGQEKNSYVDNTKCPSGCYRMDGEGRAKRIAGSSHVPCANDQGSAAGIPTEAPDTSFTAGSMQPPTVGLGTQQARLSLQLQHQFTS